MQTKTKRGAAHQEKTKNTNKKKHVDSHDADPDLKKTVGRSLVGTVFFQHRQDNERYPMRPGIFL